MDEMKIGSRFTTKLISKVVEFFIRRKLGLDARIEFFLLAGKVDDENVSIRTDVKVDIPKYQLESLVASKLGR